MKNKTNFPLLLRKLRRDEDGGVALYATILIGTIMGMVGLVIDGGSFLHLHSNLQEIADAAALAGAAELDGASDAITRATAAANAIADPSNADSNKVYWSNVAASGVQIATPVFFSSLNPDTTTTDPKQAYYIQVTTVARQVAPSFLVALVGANQTTSASAVAENSLSSGVCQPLQSFMCNPFEATETNPGNANNFATNISAGTMVHLVNGAGAAGNWGLIEAPNENGNPHNQQAFWAETSAAACISGPQGTTDTGNVAKFAQAGMNVRFDSPIASGDQSLSAPVVIDGFTSSGNGFNCNRIDPNLCPPPGNTCSGIPATPSGFAQTDSNSTAYDNSCANNPGSCPLPRDRTITNNMGNGVNMTDLQAYWKNHHSGSLPASVSSRWQLYQQEVAGTAPFTSASEAAEPHAPVCAKSTVSNDPKRRIINVGIVDCSYWGITGKKTLPPTTLYAQFFMTEPAQGDGSIYAEFVGAFGVASNSPSTANSTNPLNAIHQVVQLVR